MGWVGGDGGGCGEGCGEGGYGMAKVSMG